MIKSKRRSAGITRADAEAKRAENLIQQDFAAEEPNQKWLMDITEIPCKDGKLYLVPVLDCGIIPPENTKQKNAGNGLFYYSQR